MDTDAGAGALVAIHDALAVTPDEAGEPANTTHLHTGTLPPPPPSPANTTHLHTGTDAHIHCEVLTNAVVSAIGSYI